MRGPRKSAAYDADGNVTKAAAGFARGQGVDVGELHDLDVDGVEYVAVTKPDPGRGAAEVLSGVLSEIVSGLRSDKNMRWNDAKLSFTRPIRWLVALLGDQVVPVSVSTLAAGRTTRVHRTAAAAGGGDRRGRGVPGPAPDPRHRGRPGRAARADRRPRRASWPPSVGGTVDVEGEAALVDQIVNLVEEPTAILGGFAADYLDAAGRDPHHGDAQAPALPAGPRRATASCCRTSLPWPTVRSTRTWSAAATRRCCGPATRTRRSSGGPTWRRRSRTMKSELEKLAFEERLGSMADRAGRIAPDRAGAGVDGRAGRRRPDHAAAGGRAGEVRPRLADGRRADQPGRHDGPRVRAPGR